MTIMESARQAGLGIAAAGMAALGVVATLLAARAGGDWWFSLILTIPLGVIGGFGAVESFQRLPRDDPGHRIRHDPGGGV